MLFALLACAPAGQTDWLAQREASGPCYEANLLDGLDEQSTDELHAVYACLNQQDNFIALSGLDQSWDGTARTGNPVGVELARGINHLPDHDLDLWAFAGLALDLLDQEQVTPLVESSVELLYGHPYTQLGDVQLNSASALDKGVLRPALPGLRHASGAILDADLEPAELLADALEAPETDQLLHTLAHLGECQDTEQLVEGLPDSLGDAIGRAREASNDRWSEASGDSLRDLSESLLVHTGNDGRIALEHLADPARVILEDEKVRDRVLNAIDRLERGGQLESLPPELLYMASVDSEGGTLQAGEDRALVALLRLVHDANGEMTCSLDLWVTNLSVTLPNLSVALLEAIAEMDPSLLDGGVDLLGTVIGWQLSRAVVVEVANSGVCDVLTPQVAADLQAIDRLNDPQAGDLLLTIQALLEAIARPADSRMPEFVDALATLHAFDATHPFEELLRDIGSGPLVYDLLDLLPALSDPEGTCGAMDRPPMDLEGLWGVAEALFRIEDGRSNIERLAPVIQAAMNQEGTWVAVGNLGGLLREQGATTPSLMTRLPELLALDPELELVRSLGSVMRSSTTAAPLLRVAESEEVMEALARTELSQEGPLPFYARLVLGGTLQAALDLVDWGLDLLRGA